MQASLPTKGNSYRGRFSIRDLLGKRLGKRFQIRQNYDQSATGRWVPLSATIDTISMNFITIKTSFITLDEGSFYTITQGVVKNNLGPH
jgi:hypothetical protein